MKNYQIVDEETRSVRDILFEVICHLLHDEWGESSNGEVANMIIDSMFKYIKRKEVNLNE